jgi:hypothetical protein
MLRVPVLGTHYEHINAAQLARHEMLRVPGKVYKYRCVCVCVCVCRSRSLSLSQHYP